MLPPRSPYPLRRHGDDRRRPLARRLRAEARKRLDGTREDWKLALYGPHVELVADGGEKLLGRRVGDFRFLGCSHTRGPSLSDSTNTLSLREKSSGMCGPYLFCTQARTSRILQHVPLRAYRRPDMAQPQHPAAPEHLPWFVTAPGQTDVLMVAMAAILLFFVFFIGIIYFRLHALPDRLAHQKIQLQIVCVLGLLAMFTHMHIFWIAGLLLALVDIPDFSTPLKRIAGGLERISAKGRVTRPPEPRDVGANSLSTPSEAFGPKPGQAAIVARQSQTTTLTPLPIDS